MAVIGKLTALKVRNAPEGMHGDGGGLWLQVKRGSRSWLFRYKSPVFGRERLMGLGGVDVVSLAEARELAAENRRLLHAGKDPLEEKRARAAESEADAVTFRQAAEGYIAAHAPGWRNAKHAEQWRNTLASYAFPEIGELPVRAIDTEAVLRILRPLWHTRPETARRLRGRIESVLGAAAARGWRSSDNPARWRGHLANLLPPRGDAERVQHHAAVPWQSVAAVMAELAARQGVAPMALRFLVLTAARSGEVRGAKWSEIDLSSALWTVPAARMKVGQAHRVPLSEQATRILSKAKKLRDVDNSQDQLVFPSRNWRQPLSDAALSAALSRVTPGATVHGFRSTFRDWCAEATDCPREIAEQALAHAVSSKTEAAYRRGDLFEKRKLLMADWADHCTLAPEQASAASSTSAPAKADLGAAVGADLDFASPEEAAGGSAVPEEPAAEPESPAPQRSPDYLLACQALFLEPADQSANRETWASYSGRFDRRFEQRGIFLPKDIHDLLVKLAAADARLAAILRTQPVPREALGTVALNLDDAFAEALGAARAVTRLAPAKVATACERVSVAARGLLEALGAARDIAAPGLDSPVIEILRRGAVASASGKEDAARLRTLENLAAEVLRSDRERNPAVSGRQRAANVPVIRDRPADRALELASAGISQRLNFFILLAERAKEHSLPEARTANKTNFERMFLQTLFEKLVYLLDLVFSENVPGVPLPARTGGQQPRGLATRLAKEIIRIAAGRIPERLRLSAVWPAEADGRHPAIDAVESAAGLGDFAVASRVTKARAVAR